MVNNSARARIIPEQATEPFAAMEGPSGESLYREQKNVVLSLYQTAAFPALAPSLARPPHPPVPAANSAVPARVTSGVTIRDPDLEMREGEFWFQVPAVKNMGTCLPDVRATATLELGFQKEGSGRRV